MKNIFKKSIVLFLGISFLVSSCKKEETLPVVLLGCTDSTALNFNNLANTDDGNCEYEMLIDGCTDITAMNYQDLATNNDGSCIFAYDIAEGIWNISSECDDLIISIPLAGDFPVPLNDMFPETIEITGEGQGVVSLDLNGENVLADVFYDGTVTIQDDQKISLDTGDFGVVDVDITGSGMIESASNGDLTLNLAFEIPLAGTQTSSCEIAFIK
ncbi:hypothetical protein N9D80_01095 [Flavobacteriales bacterium]|nr:hypothetical protein [Flavobacteriales bacterium]